MIIETSWFANLSREILPFTPPSRRSVYHKSLNEGIGGEGAEESDYEGTTLLTVSRYLFLVNPMHLLRC